MMDRDDLRAAVGAGIVTEAQAASLASLADSRRGARTDLAGGDEPFELFKGFNEVFIVVGLLILAMGWAGVVGVAYAAEITNPQQAAMLYGSIGALIIWAMSEYFIRRRRMVGPAIALSILFTGNAAIGLTAYFAQPFMVAQQDYASLPLPFILGTAAIGVFWYRFRVLVAIVIDRRSFLIAAIGYIVALASTVFDGETTALTVLVLGIILLLLGAFWEKFRARLLRLMPRFVPLHRLPPSNI